MNRGAGRSRRYLLGHFIDGVRKGGCAAGHLCGVRLVEEAKPQPKPDESRGVSEDDADFTRQWLDRYRLQTYPKWGWW